MADSGKSAGVISFAIKTGIVAIAIVFVADWVIDSLESAAARTVAELHTQIQATTKMGGAKFWAKLQTGLERAADEANDLPPEQKQELIKDVRILVARWRPLLDAVQAELQKPASP